MLEVEAFKMTISIQNKGLRSPINIINAKVGVSVWMFVTQLLLSG